ncbi:hypothetical protein [Geminisphaera colitermitum]|uniref:hypothetical protein n=1 Tax=Geminisphaera colitermitum TaxID=1148786 RepID=UPI0012FEFFC0|nr:hypothetical protein [Geminisphaera colitermitum]
MKLELPKITLEQREMSPLLNILGEAFRTDNADGAVTGPGEPGPARAVRDGAVFRHYEALCGDLRARVEAIAQEAFVAGANYAKANTTGPVGEASPETHG